MKKIKRFISIITLLLFVLSVFNIGRVFASPDILKITGVSINDKSQDVDAAVLDYSNDTIRSNVSYHRLNDYTTYKVTIKNTDKIKHIVELLVDNNSADYLEYEYDGYRNTILEPNQEVDVYIKEIFRKQPTTLSNRNRSNNVVFTFNLIDEVKNESIIMGLWVCEAFRACGSPCTVSSPQQSLQLPGDCVTSSQAKVQGAG